MTYIVFTYYWYLSIYSFNSFYPSQIMYICKFTTLINVVIFSGKDENNSEESTLLNKSYKNCNITFCP